MKKIIRLTESDLHRIVKESVEKILREGAWDKYPEKDRNEAMLDMNRNIEDDFLGLGVPFSTAYAQLDDPMIQHVKGSTLNSLMSDRVGNKFKGGNMPLEN